MRARNLKPGFFKNPELAECKFEARLLFAGLWLMADKAGRLEDRASKIKMELFPADTFEVEPLLEALEGKGLIHRYAVASARYIQVVNFWKHQNPHKTEAESRIPPPPGFGELTEEPPLDNGSRPADSLIPDSLIPDSSSLRSERARRPSRRCPEDFEIPAEALATMRTECPGVNLEAETRKFRDHTFGTARSDWLATWRNWIRKAAEMKPNPIRGTSGNSDADRQAAFEAAWEKQRARARQIGFRMPLKNEALDNYRAAIDRETPDNRRGPQSAASLIPNIARPQ